MDNVENAEKNHCSSTKETVELENIESIQKSTKMVVEESQEKIATVAETEDNDVSKVVEKVESKVEEKEASFTSETEKSAELNADEGVTVSKDQSSDCDKKSDEVIESEEQAPTQVSNEEITIEVGEAKVVEVDAESKIEETENVIVSEESTAAKIESPTEDVPVEPILVSLAEEQLQPTEVVSEEMKAPPDTVDTELQSEIVLHVDTKLHTDVEEIPDHEDEEDEEHVAMPAESEDDDEGTFEEEIEEEPENDEGIEDESDSDVAVILDSSDEEEVKQRPQLPKKVGFLVPYKPEEIYDDDEGDDMDDCDDEEDYDDDDLMNDVVMSAKKQTQADGGSVKRKRSDSDSSNAEGKDVSPLAKRIPKPRDYRTYVKNRSLKWLNRQKKITSPDELKSSSVAREMGVDQSPLFIQSVMTLDSLAKTPTKSESSNYQESIIDLDSSPEKSSPQKPTTSLSVDSEERRDEKAAIMQQIDKVRETISKAEDDVKGQAKHEPEMVRNEQNKENLENNEKLQEKQNGGADKITEDEELKESQEDGDVMDVTVIESAEKTLEPEGKTMPEDKANLDVPKTSEDFVKLEDLPEDDDNAQTAAVSGSNAQSEDLRSKGQGGVKRHNSSRDSLPELESEAREEEPLPPAKKLRAELESAFPNHDRILSEYIERTSSNTVDSIQTHISQLVVEIQTLNDMIKAKEVEWNNMLHLKKIKEEIYFRLTRKKQTLEITSTKVGEICQTNDMEDDNSPTKDTTAIKQIIQTPQLASTPIHVSMASAMPAFAASQSALLNNLSNVSAGTENASTTAKSTSASSIIQNRANMKAADLAKEKASAQRLHRNILPKPSSGLATALMGQGSSHSTQPTSTTTSAAAANNPTTTGQVPISLATAASNVANNNIMSFAALNQSNNSNQQQPILNNYLTAAAHVQQQLGEMLNGHHQQNGNQPVMVGRQGVFKDVKSIIADYRSQHPETVPRRGRRVKTAGESILGNVLKSDTNSRPSSNDSSSHSMSNLINNSTGGNFGNVSFQDALIQVAKISGQANSSSLKSTPYPEVTLHPVSTSQISAGDQSSGSLLHGILTKLSRANEQTTAKPTIPSATSNFNNSNFSPTLARLLTAPERISAATAAQQQQQQQMMNPTHSYQLPNSMSTSGMNLSKVVGHNTEITITPVMNASQAHHQQQSHHSLLQQQLHQQQQLKEVLNRAAAAGDRAKGDNFMNMDDEADDSVDRLIIDEGVDSMMNADEQHRIAPHAIGQEFNENEVPLCQGCKKHEAQFVCAGCGNQWYCSRECQVTAWDDHSEVCTAIKEIRKNFNVLRSDVNQNNRNYYIVRRRRGNNRYINRLF